MKGKYKINAFLDFIEKLEGFSTKEREGHIGEKCFLVSNSSVALIITYGIIH